MENKTKWVKIGTIYRKNDGSGTFIKVSPSVGKEELAEILLKKDTMLNIFDPRKRPNITDEQRSRIPNTVVADVMMAVDN